MSIIIFLLYISFFLFQTLGGVTSTVASTTSYLTALQLTISFFLELPNNAITDLIVITVNRRILLSTVSASFTVTANTVRPPASYITALETAISSGALASMLSASSGVGTKLSSLVVTNVSPSMSPTTYPTQSPVNSNGKSADVSSILI